MVGRNACTEEEPNIKSLAVSVFHARLVIETYEDSYVYAMKAKAPTHGLRPLIPTLLCQVQPRQAPPCSASRLRQIPQRLFRREIAQRLRRHRRRGRRPTSIRPNSRQEHCRLELHDVFVHEEWDGRGGHGLLLWPVGTFIGPS